MKVNIDQEKRKKSGLSLQRFAGAKKNRYDKKARLEKTAALHAKRVNKYRKLTAKLEGEGHLKPFLPKRARVSSFLSFMQGEVLHFSGTNQRSERGVPKEQ